MTWSAHYGLATLAGLTGDGASMLHHMGISEALSDELGSPVLRVHIDELSMQYAFASGNWDAGLALSERTIATARALNQKNLLPRILVWATHFYVARGELERAKQYLDEAFELVVARGARGRPIELHSQVAVYAGLAAYYLAVGDYAKAVDIGEQGIAIAGTHGKTTTTSLVAAVLAEAAMDPTCVIGGRLNSIGTKIIRAPREDQWAPGYYSILFEDPDGIRLELNHVPGKGLLG